ncbi:MAG: hypothetical protein NXI24_19295 [bacterium]|nr:hypothetical protein [bacterium]
MNFKRTQPIRTRTLFRFTGILVATLLFATLPGGALLSQDGTGGTTTAPTGTPGLDRDEIRSPRVDFINRNNTPYSQAARRAEVASGSTLADQVIEKKEATDDGITIKRIFDKDAKGYGADVVTIEPSANIGHINRIQRVITGYLMKAFEYSEADATAIARFVLYYNANNRQSEKLLSDKYIPAVAENIDIKKLGIDRSYRNWSGNTQMVIPIRLSAVRPGETDLNNKEINEETKNVDQAEIDRLKKIQEERNREEQKKLAEKEDELKKQQENLKKNEEELKREQEKTEDSRTDTGKRLEELRNDPNADPADIKKAEEEVKEIEKKQEEVAEKIEEVKEQQEETAQKQEEVKEQQQEIAEQQEEAANNNTGDNTGDNNNQPGDNTGDNTDAAKVEELQKENEELKKAQEEKEEISENVVEDKILFMRVLRYTSKGHYNNELWYIDATKDDALQRSSFSKICSREFIVVEDAGILVTGYIGEVDDPSEHRLILLNTDDLDKKTESEERVFWNTPMINKDGKIYAIMEKDGEHYLARFNNDLTLDAASSEPVNLYSDITFYKEKIYLTGKPRSGENTTIQVFNRADLKLIKSITPPATTSASR